mgnify:CR=1 FL=1
MTPEEISLVSASAGRLAPRLEEVAHDFYMRLFAVHPEVRELFPADTALQEKKFAESIAAIVEAIPDFGAFADRAAQLGRVHAAHRIGSSAYGAVGPVLVEALAAADPGWDAATADAWGTAYDLLAETMLMSARR